ncbi:hypothetical protein PIB30_069913 [Stylosanthes scabra]|uniref:Uncharacterized protein n=1 Tax=Stylosanthes scabra TaxID=79078 RepID=A0ABU6XL63_9FABA|nr:hypothetical protein [Stylosanthes scabra]
MFLLSMRFTIYAIAGAGIVTLSFSIWGTFMLHIPGLGHGPLWTGSTTFDRLGMHHPCVLHLIVIAFYYLKALFSLSLPISRSRCVSLLHVPHDLLDPRARPPLPVLVAVFIGSMSVPLALHCPHLLPCLFLVRCILPADSYDGCPAIPQSLPETRVAPPTPPPSDDEPSDEGDGDNPEDSQTANDTSEQPRCILGCSTGSGSVTSGSASDASSDDDLVNRYFAGTFSPP